MIWSKATRSSTVSEPPFLVNSKAQCTVVVSKSVHIVSLLEAGLVGRTAEQTHRHTPWQHQGQKSINGRDATGYDYVLNSDH